VSGDEEHWEKAFQLAFFIICDRSKAYRITRQAVDKLGAQRSREKRRSYWRGRDKKLKIRRISRPEVDILQWLVYLESEVFEKEQEGNGLQTEIDLVVRYIKHLVQITTAASSFYVNVGLNRLLRNYSTPEVQQVYEFTTDRYPGPEEYRRVKGRLMDSLAARFDRLLKTRTSDYRELRFETYEDQKPWIPLVEACLEVFTPWSSWECCLPGEIEAHIGEPGTGLRHPGYSNDLDRNETSQSHWFIHALCYGELTRRLSLESPEERLLTPRFSIDGRGDNMDQLNFRRNAAPLTDVERTKLKQTVDSSSMHRRQATSQPLKIVAHGAVCAYLNPSQHDSGQFDIPDGTKLLEIHAEVNGADVLLATHWIDYTEWNGIAAGEYAIALQGKRELHLSVKPAKAGTDLEGGATVVVESKTASLFPAWLHSGHAELESWRSLAGYAGAAVLFAVIGWSAAVMHERSATDFAARTGSQQTTLTSLGQGPPGSAGAVSIYSIASGGPSQRGAGHDEETIVTLGPGSPMTVLSFAVAPDDRRSYRAVLSSFPEQQELLTENALKPAKRGDGWAVEFAVPSTVVADRTHYLVSLFEADNKGRRTLLARSLFEVRK
jgi:hypothetical protein